MVVKSKLILKHLKTFGSITKAQAYAKYGVMNLGTIIFRLRSIYKIETHYIDTIDRYGNNTRYARYEYKGAL